MAADNSYISRNLYKNKLAALMNENFYSSFKNDALQMEGNPKLIVTDCKTKQQRNKPYFQFMVPIPVFRKYFLENGDLGTDKDIKNLIEVMFKLIKSWEINLTKIWYGNNTMFFKVNFDSVSEYLIRHYFQYQLCQSFSCFKHQWICIIYLDDSVSAIRTLILASLFYKENCSIFYANENIQKDIIHLINALCLPLELQLEQSFDVNIIKKYLTCSKYYCKKEDVTKKPDNCNGYVHLTAECIAQCVNNNSKYKELINTKVFLNLNLLTFISKMENIINVQKLKSHQMIHIGSQKDYFHSKQLQLVLLIYFKAKKSDMFHIYQEALNSKSVDLFHGNVKLLNDVNGIFKTYADNLSVSFESKYGSNKKWLPLVNSLVPSVLKLDILSVSSQTALSTIFSSDRSCSSKFILYNYSRIATLLRSHNEFVKCGHYPLLPPINEITFSLLQDETELLLIDHIWQLYDCSKQMCGSNNIKVKVLKSHLLFAYLNQLSRLFSCFYNRNHVFSENVPHLLPLMHARLYLIKVIGLIMLAIFDFFNIIPLQQM